MTKEKQRSQMRLHHLPAGGAGGFGGSGSGRGTGLGFGPGGDGVGCGDGIGISNAKSLQPFAVSLIDTHGAADEVDVFLI